MAAINPCSGISTGIKLPSLTCTDSIMPDFGNLTDFGRGLGSLPGQLSAMVNCVEDAVGAKIKAAIADLLKLFDSIFGAYPWSASSPLFGNLKVPELEMEIKLQALFHEFKIYLLMQLLNILASIIGPILQIPIPFLSGCVIGDLLTPEGRAKIKAAVQKDIDAIASALGLPWDLSFSGELGFNSPEIRVQSILTRIYQEIQNVLSKLLSSALNILLKPIAAIIKAVLGIALPLFSDISAAFNFENFFQGIWNGIKSLALSIEEKIQKIIDALLDFDILSLLKPFLGPLIKLWTWATKLRDLLNFSDKEWELTSPQLKFSRVISAVKSFFTNIVTMIFELFLKAIMDAIKAIANLITKVLRAAFNFIMGFLNLIFQFIPFTFCSFLNIVAAPLLGLGDLVKGLLPPEISITPFVPSLTPSGS